MALSHSEMDVPQACICQAACSSSVSIRKPTVHINTWYGLKMTQIYVDDKRVNPSILNADAERRSP